MKLDLEKFKEHAHRPLVVTLIVLVIGTTAFLDLPEYINGIQSGSWETQTGTLEEMRVDVVDVGSSRALDLKMKYRYAVSGRLYFGERLKFQETKLKDGLVISKLEKKYKKGDSVKVYYDRSDPAKSCLEPGGEVTVLISHLVIYVMFALIIYFSAYPRFEKDNSVKTNEIKVKSATQ